MTKKLCQNCKYENKGYCEHWEDKINSKKRETIIKCSAYETKPEFLIIPEVLKLIERIKVDGGGSGRRLKSQIIEEIKNKYKLK